LQGYQISVEFTVWQEVDDDTECKPKVGQSEPGEDERENVIQGLHIKEHVDKAAGCDWIYKT